MVQKSFFLFLLNHWSPWCLQTVLYHETIQQCYGIPSNLIISILICPSSYYFDFAMSKYIICCKYINWIQQTLWHSLLSLSGKPKGHFTNWLSLSSSYHFLWLVKTSWKSFSVKESLLFLVSYHRVRLWVVPLGEEMILI